MCRKRNLHQVDLLDPAKERVTKREYWAQRRLEIRERLETERARDMGNEKPESAERNASGSGRETRESKTPHDDGKREKPSRYRTHKQQIRLAVRDAASCATDFESFAAILEGDHGIGAKMSRGRISYSHPKRERNITGRALGIDYVGTR